jgi:hypothetical protein
MADEAPKPKKALSAFFAKSKGTKAAAKPAAADRCGTAATSD